MRVQITHLKAPWPLGVVVGDALEIGKSIPAWAAGKCIAVADVAAPAVTEKSIDALKADAEALGIKVDGRWSVDRIAAEIEKAGK